MAFTLTKKVYIGSFIKARIRIRKSEEKLGSIVHARIAFLLQHQINVGNFMPPNMH
jgi:hypothetical protein